MTVNVTKIITTSVCTYLTKYQMNVRLRVR